jgi:glycosyltransferase involved in cell wall biosynthesis
MISFSSAHWWHILFAAKKARSIKMEAIPAISVVIPAHNRPDLLLRAVHSVFDQTLLPRELIVVDDGSSPPVVQSLFEGAPVGIKTSLLRSEAPQGAAAARNRGVEHATGNWIAFLDDDDAFIPEKFQAVSEAIGLNPDADLIYHPAEIRMVRESISYRSGADRLAGGPEQTRQLLVRNLVGGTSMVVAKKACLLEAGGFDIEMPALEDHALWIRLSLNGCRFFFIDKPLTRYHHDTGSMSLTHSFEKEEKAHERMMLSFAREYASLSKAETRDMERNRMRAKVFKALLNNKLRLAFHWQAKVFMQSFRLTDLLGLLVIPVGLKTVFRLRRSFGGHSNRKAL